MVDARHDDPRGLSESAGPIGYEHVGANCRERLFDGSQVPGAVIDQCDHFLLSRGAPPPLADASRARRASALAPAGMAAGAFDFLVGHSFYWRWAPLPRLWLKAAPTRLC